MCMVITNNYTQKLIQTSRPKIIVQLNKNIMTIEHISLTNLKQKLHKINEQEENICVLLI